jgi:hypothetical protein
MKVKSAASFKSYSVKDSDSDEEEKPVNSPPCLLQSDLIEKEEKRGQSAPNCQCQVIADSPSKKRTLQLPFEDLYEEGEYLGEVNFPLLILKGLLKRCQKVSASWYRDLGRSGQNY